MIEVIQSLKQELNLKEIIIKQPVTSDTKDIDVIISKNEFDKLKFNKHFYLLKDRYNCDKHIFYLFYKNNCLHVIDFNIDGLFVNGQLLYTLDLIHKNVVPGELKGIFYLDSVFYCKYLEGKRKPFIKTFRLKNIFCYIKHYAFKYQKINIPKIKVVLLGLDGSGKTTATENLQNALTCLEPNIVYMGWGKDFTNVMVKIYRHLKYRNKHVFNNNANINGEIARKSFFQLLVYYVELYHRYLLSSFSTRSFIIIYDRFFYDWLILSRSKLVEKLFLSITPKPDILFYLSAPKSILYQRKKEISVNKLEQLEEIYEGKEYLRSAKPVNTSRLNEQEITEIILKSVLSRIGRKYG